MKEFRKRFSEEITSVLVGEGFENFTEKELFEKRGVDTNYYIYLEVGTDILGTGAKSVVFRIENKAIEVIKRKAFAITNNISLTLKFRDTYFYGFDGFHEKWLSYQNIKTEEEYVVGVQNFKALLFQQVFPLFHQLSDVTGIDAWINAPVLAGTHEFKKGYNENYSNVSLISAKLVNNPRFEEIYSIWKHAMEKNNEEYNLSQLEKIKDYLDNQFTT